ncbi:YHS domain-containing protein [Thermosulfurimonas sp. F29]|uniref:YHS domain-containing protein n=1 Tax=Thermosulfurimonas sp. F29 TaxID=2867247 RepID=UPI001C838A7C|nr:YHS domain-containing protein [Thermosulfurimonas sp. F29]MBX6423001.1 YHS domain-containing protein [Thermosulfurimonas sp. F29]
MIRLILLLILVLLVLWSVRGLVEDLKALFHGEGRERKRTPLSDELVRDPVCGVYCPKSTAYKLKKEGETYYFCSEKCRERFLQSS